MLERSTYVPALDKAAYNGGDDFLGSARERLFGFINGQTGPTTTQAQGFVHLAKDGHVAEDASAANTALIDALRNGGDLLNVFGDFPTETDPRHAQAYSPLWDAQLGLWTDKAVQQGLNTRQIDEVQVFNLAATRPDLLTGVDPATGQPAPYGSVGVDINCAVIGFTNQPPTANLADPAPTRSSPRGSTAHRGAAGQRDPPPHVLTSPGAHMSHHFDSPTAIEDGRLNLCDLYAFPGPSDIFDVDPDHQPRRRTIVADDVPARRPLRVRRSQPTGAPSKISRSDDLRRARVRRTSTDAGVLCRGAQPWRRRRAAARPGSTAEGFRLDCGGFAWFGTAADPFWADGVALVQFITGLEAGDLPPDSSGAEPSNIFGARNVTAIALQLPDSSFHGSAVSLWARISFTATPSRSRSVGSATRCCDRCSSPYPAPT